MNIEKIIIKKIIYILNIHNIKYYYKDIKCKMLNNNKFGDYTVYGIYNILLKNNKTYIINNIITILNKYFCFKKVIYKNFFINFYIKYEWINFLINKIYNTNFFNINIYKKIFKKNKNYKILLDYSSPNLAKEMHIGHLRSTILGDFMFRILKFFNFNVIKSNHVGDWGLNISIIITFILNKNIKLNEGINISKIENFYLKSVIEYKINNNFKIRSEYVLFILQSNKNYILNNIWKIITKISINNNNKIYKLFNICLNNKDINGESKFSKYIPYIIKDLYNKKIAKNIKNCKTVIIKNKKNNNKKYIILQRKNKTYSYILIEIAYIKYIFNNIKANKIIYYIDNRQKNHIKNSYIISKKAKYLNYGKIIHYNFGTILNENNKPLKTKEGKSLKIKNLFFIVNNKIKKYFINKNKKKNIKNDYKNINIISKIISINYIKYNELSKNKYNNYIFKVNNFFYKNKNNFLYVQYSYCRMISILNKYNNNKNKYNFNINKEININNLYEFKLSLYLIKFENLIIKSYIKSSPNIICEYLYKISSIFSKMYEKYNILENEKESFNNIKIIKMIIKIYITSSKILGIKFIDKI
ncbi:arginine--tRNA ligase [Candidatus Nardonella dryophthoridicola]|uniref:arginine--tRNA ligase n=1 Tax=Candidatus Nardonella dryophthoridicola TaxID=1971485 RepID=UPI001AD86BB9|nr:arginine--tRNA ligase [Candidatus Nardonella dryophthoridicola]QTJ62955.1 arginine--tRNA ligase [Candidatus Nardonella dryophthoridicola]